MRLRIGLVWMDYGGASEPRLVEKAPSLGVGEGVIVATSRILTTIVFTVLYKIADVTV